MPSQSKQPTDQLRFTDSLTAFDDVMKKIVAVPKSEVEAEEKKWKTMRKRLKAKGETSGVKRRKLPPPTE